MKLSDLDMRKRNTVKQALIQVADTWRLALQTPTHVKGRAESTTVTPADEIEDLINSLSYCTTEHISRALHHAAHHVANEGDTRDALAQIKAQFEASPVPTAAAQPKDQKACNETKTVRITPHKQKDSADGTVRGVPHKKKDSTIGCGSRYEGADEQCRPTEKPKKTKKSKPKEWQCQCWTVNSARGTKCSECGRIRKY